MSPLQSPTLVAASSCHFTFATYILVAIYELSNSSSSSMLVRDSAGRTHHELWPQYDPISSCPPSHISSLLRTILILQPHFSLVPFRILFLCYLFRFVALFLSLSPLLLLFVLPSASARFPVQQHFLPLFSADFLASLLVLFVSTFNVVLASATLLGPLLPILPPVSLFAPPLPVACPFTFAFIHIHSHSTWSTDLTLV